MKIKTMNDGVFDTDKLSDIKAQFIETIEENEFTKFAQKNNVNYMIYGCTEGEVWMKMKFLTVQDTQMFFSCLRDWLAESSNNKYKLVILNNENGENENKEE